MITTERWQQAQTAEAAWHADPRWQHVGVEVRSGVRGLLQIMPSTVIGASIIDVGSGPHSIMLDADLVGVINARQSVALDPLRFEPRDEVAYVRAGITRMYVAIEDVNPSGLSQHFDEAWCYNCLQHVRDVDLALQRLQQLALRRIRLFEWLNVPESVNHPHVLTVEQLRGTFMYSSWTVEREQIGRWRTRDFDQEYFATTLVRSPSGT